MKILEVNKIDKKLPCFCVSTSTGEYSLNGLTSHNSVLIQNIILHCIEHRDKIALALIDIKQSEFSNYKKMAGIVGVANTTEEAVEILRIARAVMYKRNKELAKLGIKKIAEHKPQKRTGKVYITGRDYNEDDEVIVRVDGEGTTMKARDLVDYLHAPA